MKPSSRPLPVHVLRLTLLLALLLCAPARAAFFAGEPIDGPSADIQTAGDLDVARDGSGAVAYVRRDAGVDHIFASRLVNGIFQPPERIDAGLEAASSQPVVAASDRGRLAVLFISGGQLFATVRPEGSSAWTAPQHLAAGASSPSADMSINGVAYASFSVGGDVRAARLDRGATSFNVLADPLDVDPARTAGQGNGRSRVAIAADGTALVVWGEDGRVFGRRVFDMRVSTAPQELTLEEFDGRRGRTADLPDVDIEDDSSFAWVVFRQVFDDGGTNRARAIGRRLVGSQFEAPVTVDGLGWGGDAVGSVNIELNGRGEGLASVGTNATNTAMASMIKDDVFHPGSPLGGAGVTPLPVGGIAETQDRVVTWLQGGSPLEPVSVHAAFIDDRPESRAVPTPGPAQRLSNPDLGGVDAAAGIDGAMNRAGDFTAVFVQGAGTDRKLVAATYDRPPGAFTGHTSARWRNFTKTPLSWAPSFDLWGPITYRVQVGGQLVAQTQDTKVLLPPTVVGERTWKVTATDRRGQVAVSPSRTLRSDSTKPKVSFRVRRRGGGVVYVSAKANDVIVGGRRASGIAYVRIDWGDGSRRVTARRAAHRYGRKGRRWIRVSATDRAGNAVAVKRRVNVR